MHISFQKATKLLGHKYLVGFLNITTQPTELLNILWAP